MATGRMCEKHQRYLQPGEECPYCEPVKLKTRLDDVDVGSALPAEEMEERKLAFTTLLKFELPLPDTDAILKRYAHDMIRRYGRNDPLVKVRSLLPGESVDTGLPAALQGLALSDPLVSTLVDQIRGGVRTWGPHSALELISALAEEKSRLFHLAYQATCRFPQVVDVLTPPEPPLTSEERRLLDAYREAVKDGRLDLRWFIARDARFK